MIGRLTGVLVAEEQGALVVDVAGVGYEVLAPLGTVGRARTDGERITLHVHTHVREDVIALYGFASDGDKLAFRALIALPNVGPKIALSVLSAMPVDELAQVVSREDLARLKSIPGIGPKTAKHLLVDLKDKLAPLAKGVASQKAGAPPASAGPSLSDQVAAALTHLGFRPAQVERALEAIRPRIDVDPLPELIRQALAALAR